MAGKFSTTGKYESDGGTIFRVRVQPETINTANPVPAGAINGVGSARVGGGNRQIGVKCRSISLRWTGTVPDGYDVNSLVRVPILTKAAYDGFSLGAAFTYLGQATTIVGKSPERIR